VIPKLGLARSESLWGDLQNLYAITGFSVLISHLTTAPAAPVLLAPLAQSMAEAVGWGTKTVAMAQMVGISTPLLPYQAPPLIVAIGLAQIPVRPLMRICAVLALAIAGLGVPLCYLWWSLLGVI
jgi:di/tricarboxylate transporter